ncbi:MAG: helix-turn-helix domain-containing protein [Solirubrobacterales bacterium]
MSNVLPALSARQVADAYGLSRQAIYRAINRGELKGSKLCGRIRISPGAVAEWIVASRIEPREAARPIGRREIRESGIGGASLAAAFNRLDKEGPR